MKANEFIFENATRALPDTPTSLSRQYMDLYIKAYKRAYTNAKKMGLSDNEAIDYATKKREEYEEKVKSGKYDPISRMQQKVTEDELEEWSETSPGIRRILRNKGYKFLGQGVDQSAYLEPNTGLVLKIFGTQYSTKYTSGLKLSDDQKMFVFWSKFCMKNSDNPFLPKFYGWEKFEHLNHTYLQIRQERLYPSKVGDAVDMIADNIHKYSVKESYKQMIINIEEYDFQDYKDLFQACGGEAGTLKFLKTVKTLEQISVRKGFGFDLHYQNVMDRADGTPVIVDPWVV